MNKSVIPILGFAILALQSLAHGSDSDTALLTALELQRSVAESLGNDDMVDRLNKSIEELQYAIDADQVPIEFEDAANEIWNHVDALQQLEEAIQKASEKAALSIENPEITSKSTIPPPSLTAPEYFVSDLVCVNAKIPLRSETGALITAKIAVSSAKVAWAAVEVACGLDLTAIASGGGITVACLTAAALVAAAEEVVAGFEMCDATIDEAHLDAAFYRAEDNFKLGTHIHTDLGTHDTDIKSDLSDIDGDLSTLDTALSTHDSNLSTHDTDIKGLLDTHDTAIKDRLATHDTAIKDRLATHDTAIKDRLATHDTAIKDRLATHDTDIKALLHTHDTAIKDRLATHDTDIKALLGQTQATLDEKIELRRVFMQIVQVVQRQRYLVGTSEAGIGVDVEFEKIQVFNERTGLFEDLVSATTDKVAMGVYDLQLNLSEGGPGGGVPDKIFLIEVRHEEGDGKVDHFGRILFNRISVQASN